MHRHLHARDHLVDELLRWREAAFTRTAEFDAVGADAFGGEGLLEGFHTRFDERAEDLQEGGRGEEACTGRDRCTNTQ